MKINWIGAIELLIEIRNIFIYTDVRFSKMLTVKKLNQFVVSNNTK